MSRSLGEYAGKSGGVGDTTKTHDEYWRVALFQIKSPISIADNDALSQLQKAVALYTKIASRCFYCALAAAPEVALDGVDRYSVESACT